MLENVFLLAQNFHSNVRKSHKNTEIIDFLMLIISCLFQIKFFLLVDSEKKVKISELVYNK